ncbi:MAG: HEPN domain-containing protein [Treponema sp.]|jgi:HEPN domain-containing protein|nr:HEPN domain-containing protein [Treponema sp.]
MDAQEKFEYWLDIAQYDLDTAEAMFASGRWLYVVFMCQQAIEKLCKGLYLLYIDDNTPHIHDINDVLDGFADKLPVPVSEAYTVLFDRLSFHYIKNRYPEFQAKLSSRLNEQIAKDILSQSKEAFLWLLTMKPSTGQ